MGISRSARILTLLVIDTVFFFIELISGYAVGSLALVADSFHMLNDVLSLVVALYTIKLATSPSSSANSYGWQRAEILGALINGVFLIALCVSIFLEAVGRIVTPPEISNPKLIVIVGSLGLLSNIVGLFLFHEHGHSHGHSHGAIALPDDDDDNDEEVREDSVSELFQHPAGTRAQIIETAQEFGYGQNQASRSLDNGIPKIMSPPSHHHRALSNGRRSHRNSSISRSSESRKGSASKVPPVAGQNDTLPPFGGLNDGNSSTASSATIVTQSAPAAPAKSNLSHSNSHDHDHEHDHNDGNGNGKKLATNASDAENGHADEHDHGHGGHGHSHGSMNMQGVFLHVLGDALGNVGVIAAGLVIWFFEGRWTLYFDPAISLLITCIIFSSALPLCKSASYILLQGVPSHVSLDAVRKSIVNVDGVDSVHELHIWQLSESTVVASVHVMIVPGQDYMDVANRIRQRMHGHGIHSVTIQPEFLTDEEALSTNGEACLIRCPPDQCQGDTCCPPINAKSGDEEEHDHDHDHDHDHSH
ncbi:uncharacterized protein I206_100387 [Kwoniella pini CBS 10737]|uniref:Solute carrier family 30 (Zinc transporter), member 1 n=1 Tax=Kwoniella pini CBS 10737 TaxID=1296096 RepID=A0A1B9IDX3_9TREE|nr:solute carrier family 30 (zinc transporter), member 1 [Kwoniella pini CBS 10737]OCF53631.1 solute carrier family 30 (zinc transporter), member 1 [Kwoniella pini CBS 10737]